MVKMQREFFSIKHVELILRLYQLISKSSCGLPTSCEDDIVCIHVSKWECCILRQLTAPLSQ
jgi:hypothetical protein